MIGRVQADLVQLQVAVKAQVNGLSLKVEAVDRLFVQPWVHPSTR
jgi:hypothetical protein